MDKVRGMDGIGVYLIVVPCWERPMDVGGIDPSQKATRSIVQCRLTYIRYSVNATKSNSTHFIDTSRTDETGFCDAEAQLENRFFCLLLRAGPNIFPYSLYEPLSFLQAIRESL